MPQLFGKSWSKKELLRYLGDIQQVAGAKRFEYSEGKATGVSGVDIRTGAGLEFTVLPGRGMDIPMATYRGIPLTYASATGVTHPSYYESNGLGWMRSFFVGLLTTCGMRNIGPPGEDEQESYGIHGRISNTPAEDVSLDQAWDGDEYRIRLKGSLREARFFFENLVLTRTVETKLGWKKFLLTDVVENRGFEAQPNLLLYHFNFGYPLLGPNARVVAPINRTEPRDDEAAKDRGVETCHEFIEPQDRYLEKVFFHDLAQDNTGNTFAAITNRDIGNGTPLGVIIRFDKQSLPTCTQWKLMEQGRYVLGLEPGTAIPLGREVLQKQETLPMIAPQQEHSMKLEVEVIDSVEEIEEIEKEAQQLKQS
jgi:hypothetical protein